MQDFWLDSGFNTLERNDHGWHRVTPAFIRAILARPELAPIDDSGAYERGLHRALLDAPMRAVTTEELGAIEDADTRENYMHFLRVRKRMIDAVTLERFYLRVFTAGVVDFPPVFLDMAAQAIVRSLLHGCDDVYRVRAGEAFFRRQRVSTEGARVLIADAESIQLFADTGGFGSVGRLFAQQGTPMRTLNMDILSHENAQLYWFSENRYRYVLDITYASPGIEALAALIASWVRHFHGVEVAVTPLPAVEDDSWRWHVGLDVESTAILNDLYTGHEVGDERLARLVALFRLDFRDPDDTRGDVAGKPVYLGVAMNAENALKLKPQNLLINLPLAVRS